MSCHYMSCQENQEIADNDCEDSRAPLRYTEEKLNVNEQPSVLLDIGTQPKHIGAAVVEMRSGNILGVTRFVQVLHEE